MIPMIKRHEVQVLLAAGFTHRQVARKAGVSKRSVARIAQDRPSRDWKRPGWPGATGGPTEHGRGFPRGARGVA
jgi:hypothetical protein